MYEEEEDDEKTNAIIFHEKDENDCNNVARARARKGDTNRNTNMITRNNAKVEVFPHNKKKIHVVRRHRLLDRIFGAAFGTMKIKKSEQYYVGSGMS